MNGQPHISQIDDLFDDDEHANDDADKDYSSEHYHPRTYSGDRSYDEYGCPLLVVVDVLGIYELRIRPCRCTSNATPVVDQLLQAGLYPASVKRTRTVFTFRVLDDYDLENLETKSSAAKYYNKLKRLTSNAFPHSVPNRYRELMRVTRQWRDLKARLRAGYPFADDTTLLDGGLALFCPACPQPGVNLPNDWKEDEAQYVNFVICYSICYNPGL